MISRIFCNDDLSWSSPSLQKKMRLTLYIWAKFSLKHDIIVQIIFLLYQNRLLTSLNCTWSDQGYKRFCAVCVPQHVATNNGYNLYITDQYIYFPPTPGTLMNELFVMHKKSWEFRSSTGRYSISNSIDPLAVHNMIHMCVHLLIIYFLKFYHMIYYYKIIELLSGEIDTIMSLLIDHIFFEILLYGLLL